MFLNYRYFTNRQDAGIQLGKKLERQYKDRNALVFGIPRGGVEVAYHVAKILNAELSVIVAKKLPYPGQEELAFGAVAEDGSTFISSLGRRFNDEFIDKVKSKQMEEIDRRIHEYRNGLPLPEITNRTVILVDDGIATGSTLVPPLKLCRARKASRVIVAAPVSGKDFVPEIDELADEIIVLEIPEDYYAVGQVYDDFHNFNDDEVISILRKYENERKYS